MRDADECPSGAFERIGRDISLDALEREVMKDDIFFRTSGGGVTLSGGEVLMQAEFATRFLQRLRLWGVSCAIETAGDAPTSKLLPLAKLCDEVLFDLKNYGCDSGAGCGEDEPATRAGEFAFAGE